MKLLLLLPAVALQPGRQRYTTPPRCALECCEWQAQHCATTYGRVVDWYEGGGAADVGNWGVAYDDYEAFVDEVAPRLGLAAGDAVFESAVGAGWLLRGLRRRLGALRVAGNDVSSAALDEARRALPDGVFCVGDSLNLSWVPRRSYDAALCGYVEAGAATGKAEAELTGRWVREMARLVKPGGVVFVGNIRPPRAEADAGAGLYLKPPPGAEPAEEVTRDWWREAAASDAYGWGVDAAATELLDLRSPTLVREWGPRYSVVMRKAVVT